MSVDLRAVLSAFSLGSLSCGSLIGLGDLQKADCVDSCAGVASGMAVGSGGAATTAGATGGGATLPPSGAGGAGVGSGGTSSGTAGAGSGEGGAGAGNEGGGGEGGEAAAPAACPGGAEPPLSWTEHWFEHDQVLTRVYYDDCVALYFDADVAPAAKDWLAPFISQAWSYSLGAYGKMGSERIYAVVHQGRYGGGHVALAIDDTHDGRTVLDMGSTAGWPAGKYDLPAHLLGFLVDSLGAHTKFGAPKGAHYGNEGFPLIYKYDLFLGLGLGATAEAALEEYRADSTRSRRPGPTGFATGSSRSGRTTATRRCSPATSRSSKSTTPPRPTSACPR